MLVKIKVLLEIFIDFFILVHKLILDHTIQNIVNILSSKDFTRERVPNTPPPISASNKVTVNDPDSLSNVMKSVTIINNCTA